MVGGVASGKSLVSRRLEQLGARVLDADRIGHRVLREPEVERAIRGRWGDRVLDADGRVDRARLAAIVFGGLPERREELNHLEKLTHPRIRQSLRDAMTRMSGTDANSVLVLDAALLLEAGWDQLCDKILFVDAPRWLRLQRAVQRGWTEADFNAREAAQASVESKRLRANIVIDNSSTLEHTYEQLESVWRGLAAERADPC